MIETNPAVRYRPLEFGITRAVLREGAAGTRYLTAEAPLAEFAPRMTDRLVHWAEAGPDRTLGARRARHAMVRPATESTCATAKR